MTGPEHYREAERLLEYGPHDEQEPELVLRDIAAAQVHATLAVAAATALPYSDTRPLDMDDDAWIQAASTYSRGDQT